MNDQFSEHEELLLRSWDGSVSARDRQTLAEVMQNNPAMRQQSDQYQKIRTMLLRTEPDSFGPFFAERIMNMIKQRTQEIDYLIFFFFKKYQVLLVGVLVALLVSNMLLTDQLTVKGILGLDQGTTEDVYTIDLYDNLTK
ncbi:MAG TPA: hypothetical protein PLJ13_09815 [Cyclobacteriaceae bacterium]|nr:hypothetical protein [Cyclobacteriaceae bacterium]